MQHESHALLTLGRSSETRGYEPVACPKLFECLEVRPSIIGLHSRDETRNVFTNVGGSIIVAVESPSAISLVFQ